MAIWQKGKKYPHSPLFPFLDLEKINKTPNRHNFHLPRHSIFHFYSTSRKALRGDDDPLRDADEVTICKTPARTEIDAVIEKTFRKLLRKILSHLPRFFVTGLCKRQDMHLIGCDGSRPT